MPESSEGYDPTGQPPNAVFDRDKLNPFKLDPQTAEVFLQRLNKVLGAAERTTFEEALQLVVQPETLYLQKLNTALALGAAKATTFDQALAVVVQYRTAANEAWQYFHQRIQGLSCGLEGTWEQALNELTAHIKNLYAQIKTLEQQGVKLAAENGASIAVEQMTVAPRLAAPANGVLQETDRALLVEQVPDLIKRVERLEKVVFPAKIDPS